MDTRPPRMCLLSYRTEEVMCYCKNGPFLWWFIGLVSMLNPALTYLEWSSTHVNSNFSNLPGEMSRSDHPPAYDDSIGPLYDPQGGNYPAPPAYGFPAYNDLHPGQPAAPYPTNPNTPLYPGQPVGTPAGPYPGQPHPSGPVGAGYPPMPPIIPPTIPSDMMSSGKTWVQV